ncbi:MAG: hypothetical protein ACI8Z1_002051 [Candidatus Azotimanducaceae bacterium]
MFTANEPAINLDIPIDFNSENITRVSNAEYYPGTDNEGFLNVPVWQQVYEEINDSDSVLLCVAEDTGGEALAGPIFDAANPTYVQIVDPDHAISAHLTLLMCHRPHESMKKAESFALVKAPIPKPTQ